MRDDLRGRKYHILVKATVWSTRNKRFACIDPGKVPHRIATGSSYIKIDDVMLVPLMMVRPTIVWFTWLRYIFINGHQRKVHSFMDPVR